MGSHQAQLVIFCPDFQIVSTVKPVGNSVHLEVYGSVYPIHVWCISLHLPSKFGTCLSLFVCGYLWIFKNYLKLFANLGKLLLIASPFKNTIYINRYKWISWSFRGSPRFYLIQACNIYSQLRLLHYTDLRLLPPVK